MNYDSFLRFIFPDGLFDYFELTRFNELQIGLKSTLQNSILCLPNMRMINWSVKASTRRFICMITLCVDVAVFSLSRNAVGIIIRSYQLWMALLCQGDDRRKPGKPQGVHCFCYGDGRKRGGKRYIKRRKPFAFIRYYGRI